MEQFSIRPTIYFGPDALHALDALRGGRVLVVTDRFLAQSGLLDRVTEHLTGCTVDVFDQVVPDPPLTLVAQGVCRVTEMHPEVVLAFGGGSAIDCAKAMVYFAPQAAARPLFYAVPTTAGTGSEVTSFAVLTDTGRDMKYPVVDDAMLPHAAILAPELLAGVPASITADTGMDVLAHAAEAYVAKGASPYSDALAEKAFVMAYRNLWPAFADGAECGAKGEMLLASNLAGLAFNAAGLGICHGLAHSLGGRVHIPHGRLNAMLLPHVIRFNAAEPAAERKYARLAILCGLGGTARALASALSRLRERLKQPDRVGMAFDAAAVAAGALEDRCTAANPRTVTALELERILKEVSG